MPVSLSVWSVCGWVWSVHLYLCTCECGVLSPHPQALSNADPCVLLQMNRPIQVKPADSESRGGSSCLRQPPSREGPLVSAPHLPSSLPSLSGCSDSLLPPPVPSGDLIVGVRDRALEFWVTGMDGQWRKGKLESFGCWSVPLRKQVT